MPKEGEADVRRRFADPGAASAAIVHRAAHRQITRRPFLTLFLSGALSTLSMAPLHLWPVLFFTLPVLFWALDEPSSNDIRPWRSAAWRGWAFGFGYHVAGLYWVGFSFLVEAERFAALMPFAVASLTAGLGLFFCLAAIAFALCRGGVQSGLPRILLFAILIMIAEWLRGHILTGFPWNILGYALTMPLPMMQWAGLFGIYVLTAITVITLTAPLVVLADPASRPWPTIGATTVLPLAFALIYGTWQLQANPPSYDPGVRLRLVQPSFSQRDKFDRAKRGPIFWRHLELSKQGFEPGAQVPPALRPTHIIWPEAAVPFFIRRDPAALEAVAAGLPDDVQVIAGTFRINHPPDVPNDRITNYRVFNSAMTIGGDGRIKSIYDKIHLVPFGEYLPAQRLLTALGFENLTRTSGGLAIGEGPRRLMRIAGLPPVAMLICYEASFPDELAHADGRPGVLINLTNDAWFGTTTGPYQHLHQTRLRAVEQGVPMVRSANTGVSAVIDPLGRIVASLPLNTVGVIDRPLPRGVAQPPYASHGWLIEVITLLIMLLGLAAGRLVARS